MEKTILSQTIKNLMICISAGGALAACGGGSGDSGSASSSPKMLASTYTGITSGSVYVLTNPNSGKALDVTGAGTADGTNVEIWTKNGTAAQNWQINKNADGTH